MALRRSVSAANRVQGQQIRRVLHEGEDAVHLFSGEEREKKFTRAGMRTPGPRGAAGHRLRQGLGGTGKRGRQGLTDLALLEQLRQRLAIHLEVVWLANMPFQRRRIEVKTEVFAPNCGGKTRVGLLPLV